VLPLLYWIPSGLNVRRRSKRWFSITRDKYITSVVVVLFVVWPSIVQQTFLMFSCKSLGSGSGALFLLQDLEQKCWTADHWSWLLGVGFPMLFLYVIGIPAVTLYLMYRNAYVDIDEHGNVWRGLDRTSVVLKYSFLYKGYIPSRYYWEIVVMSRKVLITVIAVFFVTNIHVQALLAVLLVVVYLMAHIYALPFDNAVTIKMETFSLAVSFITFFAGQFFFVANLSNGGKVVLSLFIVIMNMLFVIACLYIIIGSFFTNLKRNFFGLLETGTPETEHGLKVMDGELPEGARVADNADDVQQQPLHEGEQNASSTGEATKNEHKEVEPRPPGDDDEEAFVA